MRHRAGDREPVAARRLDVRGRREPDDRARAGDRHRRLDAVRAPEREVDEVAAARGQHVPRGLRGERRVERDLVQQEVSTSCADRDRRGHLQDRLVRVDDPALGHGPDLAVEPQSAKSSIARSSNPTDDR